MTIPSACLRFKQTRRLFRFKLGEVCARLSGRRCLPIEIPHEVITSGFNLG